MALYLHFLMTQLLSVRLLLSTRRTDASTSTVYHRSLVDWLVRCTRRSRVNSVRIKVIAYRYKEVPGIRGRVVPNVVGAVGSTVVPLEQVDE